MATTPSADGISHSVICKKERVVPSFSIPDPICSQTSQNTLFFTHNLFGIILHIHVSSQFAHILRSIYCNTAFTDQTQIQPIVFLKIYTSANHTTAFPKTPAPSGAILLHMAFFPQFVVCAAVADFLVVE